MARPLKEGLDYFPHDTDALNDNKIERLVTKFGLVGYGFYFALLEKIYAGMPQSFQWNLNENAANFSRKCRLFRKNSERILNFCVECGLFDKVYFQKDSTLTSDSIRERAETILKARETKRKQRLSSGLSHDLSSGLSENSPQQTKLKVNKSKVNKSKVDSDIPRPLFSEFHNVRLSPDEYDRLVKRLGLVSAKDLIERLGAYMKSRRKTYADHYATILNWARDDGRSENGRAAKAGLPGNRPAGAFSDIET